MLDQYETQDMLNAVGIANRLLFSAWGTRPGNQAKGWERQSALLVIPGFGPDGITWGWWSYIMTWDPRVGESTPVRQWAKGWREAIELALGLGLTL